MNLETKVQQWNLTESLRMLELVLDFLRICNKCLLAGRSTDLAVQMNL